MRVPRCIAQTKMKPCRDAPGQDLWGEWFSHRELHHDVGEREKNEAYVLLGQSRTQEDMELTPQTLVVEVEGRTNPGGMILQVRSRIPLKASTMGSGLAVRAGWTRT
jgi:hypothetical protein